MNKITTFEEYSRAAASTQMESCKNEDYLRFGLMSEVGELCAIFKRAIRGDFKLEDKRADILLELGDICWYLDRYYEQKYSRPFKLHGNFDYGVMGAVGGSYNIEMDVVQLMGLCNGIINHIAFPRKFRDCFLTIERISQHFNYSFGDVLTANVEKLAKRKERGLIMGSGDHR